MTLRFQADADFNHKIVLGLRRLEPAIDFRDAHFAGIIGLPDPDVLYHAAVSGRILISHDRKTMPAHFARFLKSSSSPGLVIVPQDLDIALDLQPLVDTAYSDGRYDDIDYNRPCVPPLSPEDQAWADGLIHPPKKRKRKSK